MNAAGVFFLVLFILLIVGAGVFGAYLYRKDRQCFKKNLARCKNCRKSKNINPGNESDVSALVGQKS